MIVIAFIEIIFKYIDLLSRKEVLVKTASLQKKGRQKKATYNIILRMCSQ